MKTNQIFKQSKKRKTNPFLVISIVMLVIVAALAFSALDIFVLSEDAPVAEATYANGFNATLTALPPVSGYYTISLGGSRRLYHASNQVTVYPTLRITGTAGAAYRNGALNVYQRVQFNTTSHNDFGGMGFSGTNITSQATSWGAGSGQKNLGWYASNVSSGAGRDYTLNLYYYADDSGTYWVPFKNVPYATDTNIDPYILVGRGTDTTAPTVSAMSGNTSTWSTYKDIIMTLTDNFSGVDPASIRINGNAVSGWTENGRSIVNVKYRVTAAGTNNLRVQFSDYYGNASDLYYTIGYIDTADPSVVSQIAANIPNTTWTNQNVTLSATVRDTQSGIKSFTLAGNTATYAVGTTTNVARSVAVSANGTYGASAIDHVNKTVTLTNYTVSNIDMVLPVINNVYFNPNWTNGNVTVYIRATDSGGSGLSRVRITASGIDVNATTGSGTINGFTYTHYYVMTSAKGKIPYTIQAYDVAGNVSASSSVTPNIDITSPSFGTPTLNGKAFEVVVNAATTYSAENITVIVPCSDSGGSGIKEMKLNGVTSTNVGASSFTFTNIITADTVDISSYTIELWDVAGNRSTYTIYPKKDSKTPEAIAIGQFDWQKTGIMGNQTIQASVWTGLSGGEVQLKRTYLGGTAGTTIQYQIITNFAQYPAGTNMGSGTSKVPRPLNHSVNHEGQEYYHFRVISGAGEASKWMGIMENGVVGMVEDGQPTATISLSGANWNFESNGARTRIDNTAPQVTVSQYTNGTVDLLPSQFTDSNNYLAESFVGKYIINDGIITTGGNRSNGINSSGLNTGASLCVTYTITYGLTASARTIYTSASANTQFNGNRTIAMFDIPFGNQGLAFNGTARIPEYSIIVTDRAGNSTEEKLETRIREKPYIDDMVPALQISSVKQIIDANTQLDYDYKTEQNWTSKSIMFNFGKVFGQSGATVQWYIDPNKGTAIPPQSSSLWQTATNPTFGTLNDSGTGTAAALTIPTNSFDATIFFIIKSNAKTAAGANLWGPLFREQVGVLYKNFYIAVDNDRPNIVNYEFTNSSGIVIPQNDWSGTNVYLNVYTSDNPQGGIPGSGVNNVKVKIKDEQTLVPMTKMSANYWRSTSLIMSNQYFIEIEDNVGHKSDASGANQSRYLTYKPNIDTTVPRITATAGQAYNLYKGGYGTGSYMEAIPLDEIIALQATSLETVLSGIKIYYMKRTIASFRSTRYSVANEPGKTMINWNNHSSLWTELPTALTIVGSNDAVEHFGYDFLIISGAGHMGHFEYGTLFVDKQSPQLIINNIQYYMDGDPNQPAVGVIPAPGQEGKWTNAQVKAKLYITDYQGSGLSVVRLEYQKDNINYSLAPAPEDIELDEPGSLTNRNGFYSFYLDSYIEYKVYFEDLAGNHYTHRIKPLIDRDPVTITLNAISDEKVYNINSSNGVVKYTNKDVTININLTYGGSGGEGLNKDGYSPKGNEKYSLLYYSPEKPNSDEQPFYDVTALMGSLTEWTNEDGCKFVFKMHKNGSASYQMILNQDQNRTYYFRVTNGVEEINASTSPNAPLTYGVPIYVSDGVDIPYTAKVMLDKTAPVINEAAITYKSNGQTIDMTNWTSESIVVSFSLTESYSGVLYENAGDDTKSIVVIMKSVENQSVEGILLPDNGITFSNGVYSFEMDGYFHYYIEYQDHAGNASGYGPIIPLIDTTTPEVKIDSAMIKVNEEEGIVGEAYDNGWTYHDVTMKFSTTVGISGGTLQFSKKLPNGDWGETWVDIETLSSGTNNGLSKKFDVDGDTGEYKFRVISGSGLIKEINSDPYWIKIDKVKPVLTVTAKLGDTETSYIPGTWTSETVKFYITATNGRSLGTIEYSTDDTNWQNITGTRSITNTTAAMSISSTTSGKQEYYFRVESEAGNADSKIFGLVKIDKEPISVQVSMKRIESIVNASDYESTFNDSSKATTYNANKWTSGYVLIRITSGLIGPSGANVYYSVAGNPYINTGIDKTTFTPSTLEDNTFISYLLITADQESSYTIKTQANAKNANNQSIFKTSVIGKIMIDNSTPTMSYEMLSGDKSVKWDQGDFHQWYTSDATIKFNVGYTISGGKVWRRFKYIDGEEVKFTEWTDNDINNNAMVADESIYPFYVVKNNVNGYQTFQFKIVSGAGKTFEMEGAYTMKVDTKVYTVDVAQLVKGYGALAEVQRTDMATIVAIKNNIKPEDTDWRLPHGVKRGDTVSISISAAQYDVDKGVGYIFKRVEFAGAELNVAGDAYIAQNYVLEGSLGGGFSIDIYGEDYNIQAYFIQEIKIDYDKIKQSLQKAKQNGKEIAEVVISPSSEEIKVALQFTVLYSGTSYYPNEVNYPKIDMSYPTEVGEYNLEVIISNDNPDPNDVNYKIHNPLGQKLVIVYFENKNIDGDGTPIENEPIYHIFDVEDLGYIGMYNDPDEIFNFLGAKRKEAEFKQQNNIEIGSSFTPIYGDFKGTYDGNGKEIQSAVEIASSGVFGIFESIIRYEIIDGDVVYYRGEVYNLGIRLHLLNITSATNAGFLAGSASGALIRNCYAIGEMFVSGSGVNIGGLVGYIHNQTLMEENYTDIAFSNKGNVLTGNVGGMLGLVENSTLKLNYAIGAIEAYGVSEAELDIGTFVGSILSMMEDGDLSDDNSLFFGNKYLMGNLFVNVEITDNGGVGYIDSGVYTNGTIEVEGIGFTSVLSSRYIGLALDRIDKLGMTQGKGTIDEPFIVDTVAGLQFIDKYVWAHYVQTADIDYAGVDFQTIAAYKVFTGSYDGKSVKNNEIVTSSIKNVTINSTDKNSGIFGKVAGAIRNVDIRQFEMNINYTGYEDAYAGGIAAILVPGARLEMVFVQGNITASAPYARLRIGGIAGYINDATLIDTLSLANVKTYSTHSVDIGGTIGSINNSTMRKVFSLARVEGNYTSTGSVGAIAGTMTAMKSMSDYYALVGNTYAHGQSYDFLAGYAPSASMPLDTTNLNFMSFEQLRGTSQLRFETDNSKELDTILEGIYGFVGKGTMSSPFDIKTTADFARINNFLYANYRIRNNLNFSGEEFVTIGVGAKFTGSLSASMTIQEYIDQGNNGPRNYKIEGLTDALVYYNAGTIQDLRVDIRYNKVKSTDTTFGAIAIYNSGTIQGVTAEGYIILRVTGNGAAIVGGFVGEDLGGSITEFGIPSVSYELSSISGIALSITASEINAGGFIGRVSGPTLLSYVISNGNIICTGGSVYAGTIAGAVLSSGMVFENKINASATVYVNGIPQQIYVDDILEWQRYGYQIEE